VVAAIDDAGGEDRAGLEGLTVQAAHAPRGRFLLLALGGIALLGGLTGALVLLGAMIPADAGRLAAGHGRLMTLGFLGTVIALERAVALGRPLGYAAPVATGVGALAIVLGLAPAPAAWLLVAGGVLLVGTYAVFATRERSLHLGVQAAGAGAWPVAALLLAVGRPVSDALPWLAAFLVLTIAGERLELARLGQLTILRRRQFIVAAWIFVAGVTVSLAVPDAGTRVGGVGLLALAAWLARNDLARRTVRMPGVTRFIALSLLLGYAWLAVAGSAWLVTGIEGGAAYDVRLHALFLGFVISMVFGHAPVIVPAVLRVPLPYTPIFYGHLALLHAGLLIRIIGGDVLAVAGAWYLGGVLNVVAVLVFVGVSAAAAIGELARRRRGRRSRRPG
jgi:hypothetical protein